MRRMIHVSVAFSAGALVAAIVSVWSGLGYVGWARYVPRRMSDDEIVKVEGHLSDREALATAIVLSRYGESFRYTRDAGGVPRLYIRPSLARDEQVLWNYTTKADAIAVEGSFLVRFLTFQYDEHREQGK